MLYNIFFYWINISSDNAVGLEPEYIYMDGIEPILQNTYSSENMFAIIPLDKILVSVISLEELEKIGTEFSGASALHCQAGQSGLAGIIVSALSINSGGKTLKKRHKWNKKKTLKKKKKSVIKKSKKSFKKNKNKKTQFRKK